MKRIAFVYDHVLDIGGVEDHLISIIENAPADRFEFMVISRVSERFHKRLEVMNVVYSPFSAGKSWDFLVPFRLARLLHRARIDLLHAHSPTAALWGRLAAYLIKIPAIVTVHLTVEQYHGTRRTVRARLGRALYTFADRLLNASRSFTTRLIYVSRSSFEEEVQRNEETANRALVIPNGIDLRPYSLRTRDDARCSFGLEDGDLIITALGRLDEQKGLNSLIDASGLLHEEGLRFHLWLIGDGSLRASLEAQVQQQGLSELIKFWGFQEDVVRFLLASDIFVMPSKFEGMPFSLLNAMAAGLPAIVTPVGDLPYIVEDGITGLHIPQENPEQLASAVRRLLVDATLRNRMAENTMERAAGFSAEKMLMPLYHIYFDVLV